MKTIIVDDDEVAREVLEELIDDYCPTQFNIVARCPDINSAVKSIQKHNPDLIFLDVELQDESGFDLFNYFNNPAFNVIFTTAHDKYALHAFKFAAIDFLLKPINPEELIRSLNRLPGRIEKKDSGSKLNTSSEKPGVNSFNKLIVPIKEGLQVVAQKSILFCKGDGNYSRLRLKTGKDILVSKTLKKIEEMLDPGMFFRIHKSNIVNIHHIHFVNKNTNSVSMKDGTELRVSNEKMKGLVEFLRL